jgi:uncharacterized protein YqjF (DUF2071 family)
MKGRDDYPWDDFPSDIPHEHRPWPLPERRWWMTQTWHDLLFAHWPVDRAVLAPHVPPQFEIDCYDNQAWLGIVPFYMTNVGLRGTPTASLLWEFAELNVRTYVRANGKPGVFFFSLDAASVLAVHLARGALRLPYFHASMSMTREEGEIVYRSQRRVDSPPAVFLAHYRPTGPAFSPQPGTLEYFLTERYCLYALGRRASPYRLEIHHAPWSLQPAEADVRINTMAAAAGITLPKTAPLLHFSTRQDAVAWPPQRL